LNRFALNAPRHPPLLSEPWLRGRFNPARAQRPVTTGDGHTRWRPDQLRRAAVLVPVVSRDGGDLTVLLTRRTAHLHDHAGQISFPGGGVEPDDADVVAAALRETGEEVGISRKLVQPFGYLDCFETISSYCVTPVVGSLDPAYEATPDPREVADVFEVPLAFFLDPANLHRRRIQWRGRPREIFEFPYQGRSIWGATAAMLLSLIRRLETTP
jgi:8-oxo-dGTP pyrophosphatase MutT (NUDIX family)